MRNRAEILLLSIAVFLILLNAGGFTTVSNLLKLDA